MEQTNLLDMENPNHMFTLHVVFLPRINKALDEFLRMYNDHRLSTENNWTPNQIWYNGMLDEKNPLRLNEIDEDPEDLTFYGEDPQGPYPSSSSNNVEVSPVLLPYTEEIIAAVKTEVNIERDSPGMGVNVYMEALEVIVRTIDEFEE